MICGTSGKNHTREQVEMLESIILGDLRFVSPLARLTPG
jgi:hypothetical protein